MLYIDTDTFEISITRGDTAPIVFSAVDEDGEAWNPEQSGVDQITFAVSKKWGDEPLMEITNTYDSTKAEPLDEFWTITISRDDWLEKDENGEVILNSNGEGTDIFKFKEYVYDVQITTSTGSETIIGKGKDNDGNDIEPKFVVLGEVAKE